MLKRNSGIVNPILTAHQILSDQRTIHPGQHVIVQRIYLTKSGAHLARFGNKSRRQSGEGDEALFQVNPSFTERDKEIGARVGVDNGLQSEF